MKYKLGSLDLARGLGDVSRDCKFMVTLRLSLDQIDLVLCARHRGMILGERFRVGSCVQEFGWAYSDLLP
jgi:hypothetical protein